MVINFRMAILGFLFVCFLVVKTEAREYKNIAVAAEPGSNLLPAPQKVSLSNENFFFTDAWVIAQGSNIAKDDAAIGSLVYELKERFNINIKSQSLQKTAQSNIIRLTVKPGAIVIGETSGFDKEALKKQAYQLKLNGNTIDIIANAPAGLFYGVQTFLQLLKSENDKLVLPKGEITDWPDLDMRMIYWDDAHHLERLPAIKRAIRQAAYFKINGFALKLEGHFQFKDAKSIVEPYAYTPAEFQELTDYAKKHYVELIPFLDAPAHVAFILKHPEYANLRAYPNNNYQFSTVNPKVDELLFKMYDNLLDANKGGKYVFLSTDEAYYVGKPENEQAQAKALGGNGRLLAQFISRISNELHKKGRNVLIWGEYPLRKDDIAHLPSHLINGVYNGKTAAEYKKQGIRQIVYTSTQGVEPLFPSYYTFAKHKFVPADSAQDVLVTDDEMQQGELEAGRVAGLLKTISSAIDEKKSNFLGTVVAAWGDAGLNTETFWLGYAAGSAGGWNRQSMTAADLTNRFYNCFYGPGATEMDKVYKLLSSQAQFWNDSWDNTPSKLRTPILGNSNEIFETPKYLRDYTLSALPVPSSANLSLSKDWAAGNAPRLKAAKEYLKQNGELLNLLYANIRDAKYQQYNLRALTSVAQLCRQDIDMLLGLERINSFLKLSSDISSANPSAAVSLLDQALDQAMIIRNQRNKTYQSAVSVWYEDWFPRVAEANGRVYLDKVDDIKDHIPVRTVDMSYLIYRQLNYPLDKWAEDTQNARNAFAEKNNLPRRTGVLNWKNTDQSN